MSGKKNKQKCGIYKITNIINDKCYIGQSKEIKKRWKRHVNELNKSIHTNIHIQRAWDKYGQDNFTFEIIEECPEDKLNEREIYWIEFNNSNDYNYGYNQDSGGQEGRILNNDVRERIGQAREYASGEDCSNAKLTNEQVLEIKKLLFENELTCSEIGERFNVKDYIIHRIKNLETYKNVTAPYDYLLKDIKSTNKTILSGKDIEDIKKTLALTDVQNKELAERYKIDASTISNMRTLKSYKEVSSEYNDLILNRNSHKKKSNKLTDKQVAEIKKKLSTEEVPNKDLAVKYKCDPSSISNIKLLKSHKDIASKYNDILLEKYKVEEGLSVEEVLTIKRLLFEDEYTCSEIADIFNVENYVINRIRSLESYKKIISPYDNELKLQSDKNKRKLNEEMVREIKKIIYEEKLSDSEVAKMYNTKRETINSIRLGKIWSHVKTEYDDIISEKKFENLSLDNVVQIKKLIATTEITNKELAEKYKVDASSISNIKTLKSHTEIASEYNDALFEKNKTKKKPSKLTDEQVGEIKVLLANERLSNKKLSDKYNCDPSVISNIKLLKAYKDTAPEYNDTLIEKYSKSSRKAS